MSKDGVLHLECVSQSQTELERNHLLFGDDVVFDDDVVFGGGVLFGGDFLFHSGLLFGDGILRFWGTESKMY